MRFINILIILNIFCCVTFAHVTTNYEQEAKKFLDKANERYFKLYNQVAEKVYSSDGIEDFEEAFSTLTTVQKIARELVELSSEASQFDRTRIKDENIIRALEHLCRAADLFVLGDEYFSSILINISALKSLANDKDITPYMDGAKMPNQDNSPLAYYPDIMRIFQRSTDCEELMYYWQTWREKNKLWASVNFFTIIEAFKKAAKIMEITPLEFWFRFYDNKNFLKDMEHVMQELKPSYEQLHAFIRHQLHKKYGSEIVDPKGPIPDHLFQQVLHQTWKNGSVIEEYFPFEELPGYNKIVQNFNALGLIKETDKFYQSIGFEALDKNFYDNQLKEYSEDELSGDCKADIFDGTPQVYMFYCQKVEFRKFMQNHGYLSRVHYAKLKKNLPAYYFDSYGLEYPVGEAVILSASTPKHLTKIGLAKDFKFTDKILSNRLLRMGIHTMLQLPIFFVHAKVICDLLDGTVEIDGVNKQYWKLMEEYAGVEPPVDRMEGEIDFPYSFYLDIDQNLPTQKFVSEIIGYQFYKALCNETQQIHEFQNCDFSGNLVAGEKLKSMMELGSSKPWREVISKVLPVNETTISGKALLEYYAPILDWIKTKNAESKEKIGWNPTKKKIL